MKSRVFFLILLISIPSMAFANEKIPPFQIIHKQNKFGKISYPQISGLSDPQIQKAVNADIVQETLSWACETSGEFITLSDVKFVSADYLSFSVNLNYYCDKAAHPNAYNEMHNYDLNTGKRIGLEDILKEDFIAEKLASQIVKNYKFEGDCSADDYKSVSWDFYMKTDALVFVPNMPHANQACGDEFAIPLEKLGPQLKKPLSLESR